MTWREHIAGVLGAVIALAVVAAVLTRPFFVRLDTGTSSTIVAKTPRSLSDK
jgi:hypothetical protein